MWSGRTPSPLFILGAPRSGTSLLYRVLALHPDAAWVNNYVRRAPSLAELAALNRLARRLPSTRSRVWFGAEGDNAYRYAGRRSALERWFPQPVEGEPVFARFGVPEDGADPHASEAQLELRRYVQRLTRAAGGRVLLSKRIGHNRRVPLLHTLFPDARFVVLTRDGRAVARSLGRVDWWADGPVWWYGGTPRDWEAEGRDPLELCATHWVREVETIRQGLTSVPSEQVREVRYEDLVRDPLGVLRDLADFAGLSEGTGWEESVARLRFPDKNSGASDEAVERFQAPLLRELGYLA